MEVAALAILAGLLLKVVDFIKFVVNRESNAAITQLTVWIGGILLVYLGIGSGLLGELVIGDVVLNNSWQAVVLVGMGLGSTGSVVYDFKRARDNSDSAVTPPMIGF